MSNYPKSERGAIRKDAERAWHVLHCLHIACMLPQGCRMAGIKCADNGVMTSQPCGSHSLGREMHFRRPRANRTCLRMRIEKSTIVEVSRETTERYKIGMPYGM